jgi:hypothetical protein
MEHHVTPPMLLRNLWASMGGSIAWVRPELADGGRGHQPGETAGFSELSWPVMGVLKILPW